MQGGDSITKIYEMKLYCESADSSEQLSMVLDVLTGSWSFQESLHVTYGSTICQLFML
jgi:hypothetical protein